MRLQAAGLFRPRGARGGRLPGGQACPQGWGPGAPGGGLQGAPPAGGLQGAVNPEGGGLLWGGASGRGPLYRAAALWLSPQCGQMSLPASRAPLRQAHLATGAP
jgi:hypothetical protein